MLPAGQNFCVLHHPDLKCSGLTDSAEEITVITNWFSESENWKMMTNDLLMLTVNYCLLLAAARILAVLWCLLPESVTSTAIPLLSILNYQNVQTLHSHIADPQLISNGGSPEQSNSIKKAI